MLDIPLHFDWGLRTDTCDKVVTEAIIDGLFGKIKIAKQISPNTISSPEELQIMIAMAKLKDAAQKAHALRPDIPLLEIEVALSTLFKFPEFLDIHTDWEMCDYGKGPEGGCINDIINRLVVKRRIKVGVKGDDYVLLPGGYRYNITDPSVLPQNPSRDKEIVEIFLHNHRNPYPSVIRKLLKNDLFIDEDIPDDEIALLANRFIQCGYFRLMGGASYAQKHFSVLLLVKRQKIRKG